MSKKALCAKSCSSAIPRNNTDSSNSKNSLKKHWIGSWRKNASDPRLRKLYLPCALGYPYRRRVACAASSTGSFQKEMRYAIWNFLTRNVTPGNLLPFRLRIVWAILFPGDFIFYQLGKRRGYDPSTDCFLAHGFKFHSHFLFTIAHREGVCFRVVKHGDTLAVEELDPHLTVSAPYWRKEVPLERPSKAHAGRPAGK